jgi:pilus assembly protein CpaF
VSGSPLFGRRRNGDETPPRPGAQVPAVPPVAMNAPVPMQSTSTSDSLAELRTLALQQLDPAAAAALSPERLSPEIEKLVADIATERRIQLNAREQRQLASELVNDMLGLGPLQPLLDDDGIADIMVNGPDRVFIEKGGRVTLSNVKFRDAQHVANICQRIASGVGRRIDESSPMVDARLMDGSRVNIVFPPLALDGPYISIRKFTRRKIDFARLVAYGSLTAQVARVLEIAGRSRLNMIISGGTGSGKTTLLNALSRMIDPAERVITIEDAAELQLQQPHVVRMEGKGEVTQRDLVKNALRMRPERIIIGEVRGGEAFDMLQAMNTGHDGSMSTIHANNTRDALTRVENMVQMGNMGLPSRAIKTQVVGAVDLILQVERHRDGGRRVTQVTDVVGLEGDVVILNDLFQFEFTGETPEGRLSGTYKMGRGRPSFWERLVYFGMDRAWVAAMEETNW